MGVDVTVKTPTVRDSLLGLASDAPPGAYSVPRTYLVRNGRNDGRLDLDPPADAQHLKPLSGVVVWGPAGYAAIALPGDRVVVIFRDGDPRSACVVAFEPLPTGKHRRVSVDADHVVLAGGQTEPLAVGAEVSGRRAVCYGDLVQLPVAGALASGSLVQAVATTPNAISRVSV